MARGRPKTPAQGKVIRGNFRPDRDTHGPVVELGLPECPAWLPRSAKKYWKQIGPELAKQGLIAKIDSALFAAHCDSVGKFEEVTKLLKTIEDTIDKTPQGYQVQSALFTVRNKLWDQIKSSSTEFGLSPAARSRVNASPQQQLPMGDGWDNL